MLFVAAILGIGMLLGWGFGGGLRALADVTIRWWPVAPVALILQVAPLPEPEGPLMRLLPSAALAVSYLALVALAAVNWRLWGFVSVMVGLAMNATVIAANGGMPVSETAMRGVGADEATFQRLREDPKHHLARGDDVLLPLGDVIPVRRPFGVVVSVGDVLAYSGAATFLGFAMNGRPYRRPPTGRPGPQTRATRSGTRQ